MLMGWHRVIFQIYLLPAFVSCYFSLLLLALFEIGLSIFDFEGFSCLRRSGLLVSVIVMIVMIVVFGGFLVFSSLFCVFISIFISLMFGIIFSSSLGFFVLITHSPTIIFALSFYLYFSSDFSTSLLNQLKKLIRFHCLELFFSSSYFSSF